MNRIQICVACDCVVDRLRFTIQGNGPFCEECREALHDPDQALLTEKRLAESEKTIEVLRAGLEELQRELQMSLMRDKEGQQP
jgi:hypothetical protein